MARKIIVLERLNLPSDQDYRVALWFDVVLERQPFHANATATSAVKNLTQAELTAIQSGAIIEEVIVVPTPAGVTLATLLAGLVSRYSARQLEITNRNQWARYGSSWDGTSWTQVVVP